MQYCHMEGNEHRIKYDNSFYCLYYTKIFYRSKANLWLFSRLSNFLELKKNKINKSISNTIDI